MAKLARLRELPAAAARAAMIPCMLLGLAACDTGPAEDNSPFVRTTRGDFVQSTAPGGIKVTLGSKLVRPAGEPARLR